jgi:hypothetical protein
MKREIDIQKPEIMLNDVKKGDVLLSCGRAKYSHAIRLLDGGDYSHAAICTDLDVKDGPKIIESTRIGVVENPLKPDITDQEYVDVYRFQSDTGETFGSAAWPSQPVIRRANYYRDQKTQYAFNQLYLMSILIFVRKAPIGKLGKANLRLFLDQMIRFFKENSERRKKQVTCSEMVYRCFYDADAAPKGKYGLTVRVTIGPDRQLIKGLQSSSREIHPELDGDTQRLLREAEDLFLQNQSGLRDEFAPVGQPHIILGAKAPNPNVNADLVTPRDLQMSPNLKLLGRLRH